MGKNGFLMVKVDNTLLSGAALVHLDSKGRLAMPTRYRDYFANEDAGQLVVTIDLHFPCLLLYSTAQWQQVEQQLLTLSSFNLPERRVQRLLLGHAHELLLDKAGRVLIPPLLRAHAKLSKNAVLVGQLNKFELWDETHWQQQIQQDLLNSQTSENSASLAKLQDLAL